MVVAFGSNNHGIIRGTGAIFFPPSPSPIRSSNDILVRNRKYRIVSIVNCDSDTRSHNFTIFIIIAIAKRRNLRLSLFNYLSLTGTVIRFGEKTTRSISSSNFFFFFDIRNFHIIQNQLKKKKKNKVI